MSTIYIVTSGEYSDYGMDGVFSTEELAQAFVDEAAKVGRYSSMRIEEWQLDERAGECSTPLWGATIRLEAGEIEERIPVGYDSPALWPQGKRGQVIGPKQWGERRPWADVLSSVSQEHANKLAVEARQKWLRDEAYRTTKRLDMDVLDREHPQEGGAE